MYTTFVTSLLLVNLIYGLPFEDSSYELVARSAPPGNSPLNAYIRRISLNYLEMINDVLRGSPSVNKANKRAIESYVEVPLVVRAFQDKNEGGLWGRELESENTVERKRGTRFSLEDIPDGLWGRELESIYSDTLHDLKLRKRQDRIDGGLWGKSLKRRSANVHSTVVFSPNGLWSRE